MLHAYRHPIRVFGLDHADELAKRFEDYDPDPDDERSIEEYLLERAVPGWVIASARPADTHSDYAVARSRLEPAQFAGSVARDGALRDAIIARN
jgi:hypothetical protein